MKNREKYSLFRTQKSNENLIDINSWYKKLN